jgi:predicted RNA-binding protein
MKRILFPNTGPDLRNTQKALILATVECEKLGIKDVTVVVGTKKNFESTAIGKLLGHVAKKLAKGEVVSIDSDGHKVQLESVSTIQKLHTARVVIGLHLTPADIQKLDDLLIDVLIYVPFTEPEGLTWAAKWAAETFGVPNAVQPIDLPVAVIESLKDLTSSVNLSTGLQHSSDLGEAKKRFGDLQTQGIVWNPVEVEKWAVQHNWKASHAEALAQLSARYLR